MLDEYYKEMTKKSKNLDDAISGKMLNLPFVTIKHRFSSMDRKIKSGNVKLQFITYSIYEKFRQNILHANIFCVKVRKYISQDCMPNAQARAANFQ